MLEVLLREHAEARDDDRINFAAYATILTVALAALVGLGSLLFQTCQQGFCGGSKLTPVPYLVYIAAPIVPAGLLAFGTIMAVRQNLRSYYLREIERRIHLLTSQYGRFPLPSWTHLNLSVDGQHDAIGTFRALWNFILLVLTLAGLGVVIVTASRIHDARLEAFSVVFDIIIFSIPVTAAVKAYEGQKLWHKAEEGLPSRFSRTDQHFPSRKIDRNGERGIISWLLLPRREEELLKALFIPLVALFIWIVSSSHWKGSWLLVLGSLIVFEYLLYQARYMVNDMRDRNVDHKQGLNKRRFPSSANPEEEGKWLHWAYCVFLGRILVAFFLIATLMPLSHHNWEWILGFIVSFVLYSTIYETVRTRIDRDTRDVESKPSASGSSHWKQKSWVWFLILVSGCGYAYRAVIGLWAAGVRSSDSFILAGVAAFAFGAMFVGLAWAIESTKMARLLMPANNLEGPANANVHANKMHLDECLRWAGVGPEGSKILADQVTTETVLLDASQSFQAPWSVLLIACTAALAEFCTDASQHIVHTSAWSKFAFGAVLTLLAAITVKLGKLALWIVTMTGFAGAAGWFIWLLRNESWCVGKILMLTIFATLGLLTSASFRSQSYTDLRKPFEEWPHDAKDQWLRGFQWFIRRRDDAF